MASESKSTIEIIATSAQVISVVIAALISVLSFNSTRVKEAEAIYLRFAGQPMGAGDARMWTSVVLEDFDALRKAGFETADMIRIAQRLKAPKGGS